MQVDNGVTLGYNHGVTETVLHPIVAVAMIIAIVLILLLPRKYAAVPFLIVVFLSPMGQEIYIAGIHLFVLRILIAFGWFRMLWAKVSSKAEIFPGGINAVDKVFFLWAFFRAFAALLLSRADPAGLVNLSGFLWDAWGGYFLLRFLIQDEEGIAIVTKTFAAITVILAVTMLSEKFRDQNIFGYLGGVPVHPDVREGSIRAQGTFEHSILAGVFAATLLPLFLWLWQSKRSRIAAVAGAIGCTLMVLTTASSTPLLAYLAVIVGLCFWAFRKNMRVIRWGIVIALVSLNFVMKSPVWFLISHVDLVAGNSGYHRAELIDVFVKHFWDWWLIGTDQVLNWGYDMWDMSNQFVAEGEVGGLPTFICFILMISWSFGRIGKARNLVQGDRKKEWCVWLLGIALFAHCVAYFGISYFDQTKISWYALIVIISVATGPILATKIEAEDPAFVRAVKPQVGRLPLGAPVSNRSSFSR